MCILEHMTTTDHSFTIGYSRDPDGTYKTIQELWLLKLLPGVELRDKTENDTLEPVQWNWRLSESQEWIFYPYYYHGYSMMNPDRTPNLLCHVCFTNRVLDRVPLGNFLQSIKVLIVNFVVLLPTLLSTLFLITLSFPVTVTVLGYPDSGRYVPFRYHFLRSLPKTLSTIFR